MFGAIVGDYLGALHERSSAGPVDFDVDHPDCRFTDASVLTVATAEALMNQSDLGESYRAWFDAFPGAGFTSGFRTWIADPTISGTDTTPELRASPAGWGSPSPAVVDARAAAIAMGCGDADAASAVLVAGAIAIARKGCALERSPTEIADAIRAFARFRVDHPLLADGVDIESRDLAGAPAPNVIVAILALRDAEDFEMVLRKSLVLRRPGERVVSIASAIAEAMFGGVPEALSARVWRVLPATMQAVVLRFWMTP